MSFAAFMNQSATYQNPGTTRDKQGRTSLGSTNNVSIRFQRTHKVIKTEERDREPIHGIVFSKPGDAIELGAKITYDSTDYRVMTKEDVIHGDGSVHHRELMVQEWSFAS